MSAFEIARLALLTICSVVGLVMLRVELRGRRENMCDTCENLKQKRAKSVSHYRYECVYCSFDKPPEYCKRYEERGGEKHE